MTFYHQRVHPGPEKGTVLSTEGKLLRPPESWSFLPAGDGAITRMVKARCSTWVVQVKKGRRWLSRGIWADTLIIEEARSDILEKRSTPAYEQTRKRQLLLRERRQKEYEIEFFKAVLTFLDFHHRFQAMATALAEEVTAHSAPIGSGTVARTKRIPLPERAEAAVIAWLRHNTTTYDTMNIERIRGRRREVRRLLANRSKELLNRYRHGDDVSPKCPLMTVLQQKEMD